jgi:hypothetical protein
MAAEQRIALPYAPRRIFLPYHKRAERLAFIVAHGRCGKTVACINDMIKRAPLIRTDSTSDPDTNALQFCQHAERNILAECGSRRYHSMTIFHLLGGMRPFRAAGLN